MCAHADVHTSIHIDIKMFTHTDVYVDVFIYHSKTLKICKM